MRLATPPDYSSHPLPRHLKAGRHGWTTVSSQKPEKPSPGGFKQRMSLDELQFKWWGNMQNCSKHRKSQKESGGHLYHGCIIACCFSSDTRFVQTWWTSCIYTMECIYIFTRFCLCAARKHSNALNTFNSSRLSDSNSLLALKLVCSRHVGWDVVWLVLKRPHTFPPLLAKAFSKWSILTNWWHSDGSGMIW